MKVLVTGANGFIGSEVISRLISENFEIFGVSRNEKVCQNTKYSIVKADITDKNALLNLFENSNFDAIVHCAGLAHQFGKTDREDFENVNVKGTKNIAELAVKINVKHILILSSTAVYGLQNAPMSEQSECFPDTYYAESKLKAEKVCRKVCEQNNIQLTIFRLAPVLGEKGIGNVPRLIESIYKKRFVWVGKGENKKSLVYVGDIADACLKVLKEKKKSFEVYNVSAKPIKMRKLVSIISDQLDRSVPNFSIPEFLPDWFFKLNQITFNIEFINRFSKTFDKWLSEDIYPADKFEQDYGFAAQTSIEKAVIKQCDWFLRNKLK